MQRHTQAIATILGEPRHDALPSERLRCGILAANKNDPLVGRDGHHDGGAVASGGRVLGVDGQLHFDFSSPIPADSKRNFGGFLFGAQPSAIGCRAWRHDQPAHGSSQRGRKHCVALDRRIFNVLKRRSRHVNHDAAAVATDSARRGCRGVF